MPVSRWSICTSVFWTARPAQAAALPDQLSGGAKHAALARACDAQDGDDSVGRGEREDARRLLTRIEGDAGAIARRVAEEASGDLRIQIDRPGATSGIISRAIADRLYLAGQIVPNKDHYSFDAAVSNSNSRDKADWSLDSCSGDSDERKMRA